MQRPVLVLVLPETAQVIYLSLHFQWPIIIEKSALFLISELSEAGTSVNFGVKM